jgi:hypothetical protein
MKTKLMSSKRSNLPNIKSLHLIFAVVFLLVLSCAKKDVGLSVNENALVFNTSPESIEQAYQQTLSMYNYKIQPQAIGTFMQGVSMINDSDTKQTYELITKNGVIERLFTSPTKNGRTSGENTLNLEEVNKIINSKDVSKHTRKHLSSFYKELEKIKSKASNEGYDADKAILNELAQLEKNSNKDSELNANEKVTFATITQTLRKSYNQIRKSAEKAQAGKKTNCWLCAVFNVIVTVVFVAVIVTVAIVGVAAIVALATSTALTATIITNAAIIGGAFGTFFGLTMASIGYCFVLIDYGQITYGYSSIFGMEFGPC